MSYQTVTARKRVRKTVPGPTQVPNVVKKIPPIKNTNQLVSELLGIRLVKGVKPSVDTTGALPLKYEQVG